MSSSSIKTSTNHPNEAVKAIVDALMNQFDGRNVRFRPQITLPICKLTYLLARIVVAELLCEAAALLAMDGGVIAVDRRLTITANNVDQLVVSVGWPNDSKEQDPPSSGPRTCSVGDGRGLAAVLGRWSCG
jgi:hypothetical protein